MCLIAVVNADSKPITRRWIKDIFKRNKDGFGFMWHDGTELHTVKAAGNIGAFLRTFRQVQTESGNNFAVHTRMATHGEVNDDQAHPYPITFDGKIVAWLMHNGILPTGNKADVTKSDTWHFISDYIEPIVADAHGNAGILHNPAMRALMGDYIEDNRFVIMTLDGEMSIVNKKQGLEWNGMWLSNTYAWSAAEFGAKKPATTYSGSTYRGNQWSSGRYGTWSSVWDDDGWDDGWGDGWGARQHQNAPSTQTQLARLADPPATNVVPMTPAPVTTTYYDRYGVPLRHGASYVDDADNEYVWDATTNEFLCYEDASQEQFVLSYDEVTMNELRPIT